MGAGTKFNVDPASGLLVEGVDVTIISGTMQVIMAR
jgi:hypothetical protein